MAETGAGQVSGSRFRETSHVHVRTVPVRLRLGLAVVTGAAQRRASLQGRLGRRLVCPGIPRQKNRRREHRVAGTVLTVPLVLERRHPVLVRLGPDNNSVEGRMRKRPVPVLRRPSVRGALDRIDFLSCSEVRRAVSHWQFDVAGE